MPLDAPMTSAGGKPRLDAPMTTLAQALRGSGIAPVDGEILLAHVLGRSRAWVVAHATDDLAPENWAQFAALAQRRRDGEPVAYLTGTREFYGLSLTVSPAVLIPRPETETLVDLALACIAEDAPARVLDLGTGSGAIALALAQARPAARVVATDISAAALALARENGRRLGLANVEFVLSDWYAGVPAFRFDCIVANPPYVAAADPHLGVGDLRFEPRIALTPGGDGLGALQAIVAGAAHRLVAGGTLAVEHGYDQAAAVAGFFLAAGFAAVNSVHDLAGIARATAGTRG